MIVDYRVQLSESIAYKVLELAKVVSEVDGIGGISEQPRVHMTSQGYEHYLMWIDDSPIAYAHITPGDNSHNDSAELIVHPDYRNRHIGSGLIARILADRPHIGLWAYGNLAPAQKIAKKFNLRIRRTLLQMSMVLEKTYNQGLDKRIRTYKTGDEQDILKVNNAAFSWHPEQGGWHIDDIYERLATPWFDPKGLFIAQEDNRIIGFHWTKIHPDISAGEIYILAVDPDMAGQGIGKALTQIGLEYFREHQLASSILYVEDNNLPALRVYEKMGYQITIRNCVYGQL